MAQAGKPTKKTRHIDIKHFSIQQWTELDLLLLKHIKTTINSADSMTKAVARTLFYRHMDFIMGRYIPEYIKHYLFMTINTNTTHSNLTSKNSPSKPDSKKFQDNKQDFQENIHSNRLHLSSSNPPKTQEPENSQGKIYEDNISDENTNESMNENILGTYVHPNITKFSTFYKSGGR